MRFGIGDAVRLKAHPAQSMRVIEVADDWVICRWFDKAAVQEGAFSADDLESIPDGND
ncbi:hypothetical protein ACFOYU_11380 [Microvirga sp. GCM10011540]|uniref:hypothetical protein n=1 Tax=Microvirga sp. GCM10011540 TaxID=3317338 RepID=UPI003617A2BC